MPGGKHEGPHSTHSFGGGGGGPRGLGGGPRGPPRGGPHGPKRSATRCLMASQQRACSVVGFWQKGGGPRGGGMLLLSER